MTITLSVTTEARLVEKAQQDGTDVSAVAEALILAALEWDAQEMAETVSAIRRSDQAASEGRERPLQEFISEQRLKHKFAPDWPQERSNVG
jgi:post-segregation antitoxin (ccd killing protein)